MSIKGLVPLIIDNPFEDPIIPDRIKWSVSQLKLFRKCKRKWFWKYALGLRPHYRASALMIGSAFHETLEQWYGSKRSSMKKIVAKKTKEIEAEAIANCDYYDQAEYDKMMTLIKTLDGMLIGYSKRYAAERKKWNIIKDFIEAEAIVDLGEFDFHFKIDLLVKAAKKKAFLVEHKSAAIIGDSYIERLPLDAQVRGYIFGATHKKGFNVNVSDVIYDVVKKCKLRKKSNELRDDFTARIAQDYIDRPEFYFVREKLKFNKGDIKAFEYELRLTHAEWKYVIESAEDPLDPRCWCPSDNICSEFFKTCPYQVLCLRGLDRGSAHLFEQRVKEETK